MPLSSAATRSAVVLLSLTLPVAADASDLDDAQRLCQDRIREVYGVSKLRDVWAEQIGNNKFMVYGHDAVEARVRHDQDRWARVALRNTHANNDQLFGEATVTYGDRQPHLATFTCYFDNYGRVVDSSYQLY